ncbi:ThiF family adenylyltransferase [Staphylococcus pettenkoferi]|uniref:ThiF family adenylyltransferase n=1 Tax=Staphylococcus pettenkoferi TaxID=170573 RepID=A0A9Q4H417_9STAP|nr:ThiF family adenylyltransferase [Staphylococcus pettenkoferi]MCY1569177.1 ThiF family adenylyltransferase [Staphylococcus pettenkoferi]MCY1575211.1 ThiF family adenylyltransferase [Staphylococcus pettenkoferi]MCY1593831.1 ThiF family adenylyltransferase [Staphylococcus pettenkoferi]MCY1618727.1 ThiF family adenylyltransferase [Staphylococcus pettenkoferi]
METRYSRQILYKNIGSEGQEQLAQSHVLIVGMGALGTHVADGLTRSGVGELTIVDRDYIEYSNLQRQTLFTELDAQSALPKVVAAQKALEAIRSDIHIHSYIAHVDQIFLDKHGKDVDLIIDATDNFETRQRLNDFAYQQSIPWIYGAVVQSTYTEAAFIPGQTPCFNCVMPNLPSISMTCDTVGVIQPAVTMTTSLQIRDALKLLTNKEVAPQLTFGDIWEGSHHTIGFRRMHRDNCETCGSNPTYPYLKQAERQYAVLCGRDTVQYYNQHISQEMIAQFLGTKGMKYKQNDYMLMFEFKGHRIISFTGGRMLIHGMRDPNQAATLIGQLFG